MAVGRIAERASTRFDRNLEGKKKEELSDLKELFLFTLGIVSRRKKKNFFSPQKNRRKFCYIKMRKHEKLMSFQIVLFCMQIISEVLISINA